MSSHVVLPPATIGMLGGGQLGRLAIMAAASMGYRTIVVDPDPDAPAGVVAGEQLVAAYDDDGAVRRLSMECDVVTVEFENPPAETLDRLDEVTRVAPSATSVRIAQDRIAEKAFLRSNGFPVGPYAVVTGDDPGDLDPVLLERGAILKTARLGYDGKGQRRVGSLSDLLGAWAELGGVPCVVEAALELSSELSVVVARTHDARSEAYAVTENTHVDGILDVSVAPAPISSTLADRATGLAMAVADALDYVGVLAVELFVVGDEVFVNELAPRPHNSGHWTLDGAATSQFEQQIRAVCGLGLGDPSMTVPAVAMANLLGDLWADGEPGWSAVLDDPHVKLHLYGKSQPRPGRKMGHLTVISTNTSAASERVRELRARLTR